MFEGNGLLDLRVDFEVLAVQVSQAVVLPQQQVASYRLAPGQQGSRQHQAIHGAFHSVAPKSQ